MGTKGTKLSIGAGVVFLLAVASVTAASAGSSDADNRRSVEVLRLDVKEVDSIFLDLGVADLSIGDQFAFTNDLHRGGAKIGEDGGLCAVTRLTSAGASTWHCVGSNALPGGQITVAGIVTYAPGEEVKQDPYFLAITGGTGRYRAARGQVKVEEVSGQVTLRIVR